AAKGHAGPFLKHFRHATTNKGVIDFVGTGGQVVCPPSSHHSGGRRAWSDADGRPVPSPGEPGVVDFVELWNGACDLAAACEAKLPERERPKLPAPPEVRSRPHANDVEARASAYLKKMPPAVSGQGGHSRAFAAARAAVYGFDLGREAGFRLLRDEYNLRCEPPWSERELWHKVNDADRPSCSRPRGWLRDSPLFCGNANKTANTNGHHTGNGKAGHGGVRSTPAAESQGDRDVHDLTGCRIILNYFVGTYRPQYRAGTAIRAGNGEDVPMGVGCTLPTSALMAELAKAADAPRVNGVVKVAALPSFFKTWARVAWGDMLQGLPDEDGAGADNIDSARDEFRQMVRDAMLTECTLSQTTKAGPTKVESRIERDSLIGWCQKFAKPGPWRSIRGKRCWCKLVEADGGELQLRVAIDHGLFAQVKADRRLVVMGQKRFSRRAKRYGVGQSRRDERPHGNYAVILDPDFVAELVDASPADDGEEFGVPRNGQVDADCQAKSGGGEHRRNGRSNGRL
ncbi:MAG TPA: hypothetical protein VGF55_14880, partial [Gemmataceae bacterium]